MLLLSSQSDSPAVFLRHNNHGYCHSSQSHCCTQARIGRKTGCPDSGLQLACRKLLHHVPYLLIFLTQSNAFCAHVLPRTYGTEIAYWSALNRCKIMCTGLQGFNPVLCGGLYPVAMLGTRESWPRRDRKVDNVPGIRARGSHRQGQGAWSSPCRRSMKCLTHACPNCAAAGSQPVGVPLRVNAKLLRSVGRAIMHVHSQGKRGGRGRDGRAGRSVCNCKLQSATIS